MKRVLSFFDEALSGLVVAIAGLMLIASAYGAADFGNTSVISPTDASNNTGTCPSHAENQAPSSLNDGIRCLQGAAARWWQNDHPTVTSGGSANTQTLNFTPDIAAYYNGQRFCYEAGFTTSGASTLNVDSVGAVAVKVLSGGVLSDTGAGTITAGDRPCVTYRSTGPSMVCENCSTSTAASTSAAGISELATTTETLTGTDTGRTVTPDGLAALWEKGSDIASSGTISIGEGGFFHVTGTTTITDIDFATAVNGRCARLEFDGALTLTHHSTTLVLPGAANITTAAGDQATVCQDAGDNVHVTAYAKANAIPVPQLADPNADRIYFWDDSAGKVEHLTAGTGLQISGTTLSTTGAGLVSLGTLTTTSGATHSITDIASTYKAIYFEVNGVSFDTNTRTLNLAVSNDNGSNYGTSVAIGPSLSTALTCTGIGHIYRMQTTTAFATVKPAIVSSGGGAFTETANNMSPNTGSGPFTAIRFSLSDTGNFDAGTITVYGVQ